LIDLRMAEPPVFFLPSCPPHEQEETYAHIASKVDRSIPCFGNRVYAVSFQHDGTLWIATVGERLKGRKQVCEGRQRTDGYTLIEDLALVLAIFPDDPYCIFTDSNPGSQLANPLYAETPIGIEYFFWPRRYR
jgi:hypothetical protein